MSETTSDRSPLRILLAEDEEPARHALSRLLAREGHQVTAVADGQKAFETIRKEPFDVALLDISMPGMTGWQVASRLQETAEDGERPVLVAITSHNRRRDRERSRRSGFAAHLGKPFDYYALRRLLTSLAAGGAAPELSH